MSIQQRYPPIERNDLLPNLQQAYDQMSADTSVLFGPSGDNIVYQSSKGGFLGPFSPMLQTPKVMAAWLDILKALAKLEGLTLKSREVVTLAIGSAFKAPYELYACSAVARSVGLSETQIALVVSGVKPAGGDKMEAACEAAFDLSLQLVRGVGPLPDSQYSAAEEILGRQGTLAVVNYAGF